MYILLELRETRPEGTTKKHIKLTISGLSRKNTRLNSNVISQSNHNQNISKLYINIEQYAYREHSLYTQGRIAIFSRHWLGNQIR